MKIMQSKGINYRSVALFIYRHFALPPDRVGYYTRPILPVFNWMSFKKWLNNINH